MPKAIEIFFSYCDHTKKPSKVCKACFSPYVRVFHLIWVLSTGGGGVPKGLVHNQLMQLFTVDTSKVKVSETFF